MEKGGERLTMKTQSVHPSPARVGELLTVMGWMKLK